MWIAFEGLPTAAASLSSPAASLTSLENTPGGRAGRLSTGSTLISSQKWGWPAGFTLRRTAFAFPPPKGCVLSELLAQGQCLRTTGDAVLLESVWDPEGACVDLGILTPGGVQKARSASTAPGTAFSTPIAALQDPQGVFISFPESAHGPQGPAQSRCQPNLCSGGLRVVCGSACPWF